ncbi:helix-turn-helix transcriptional regulator [Streptomyces sp. NPDC102476]|uniref:helix-turn-helix transcriptional regulator n=1 Tax=Streptomyces sp. NPDC102476 TaxID=3366181 RepID=UPI0038087D05
MPSVPPPDWVLVRRRALGDRIREVRRERKLSQERLAELAGLDRQAVNRIEQGHQSPVLDNLIRLAVVLEMEVVLAGPVPEE